MFIFGTGIIFGTERIDCYLAMIHFYKFNQFLLSKFVYLYSYKIGKDFPSVAPSSAGVNHESQLITGSTSYYILLSTPWVH